MTAKPPVKTRALPIEEVISVNPFIVRRRIAFRDCDPAGIVYTPRFLDPIATSALELFMSEIIGLYGQRDKAIQGLDLPAKAVTMVFHNPVSYGDIIELRVFCSHIGTTTFESTVSGYSEEGLHLFDCAITSIAIDSDEYRSTALPEYLIKKLSSYQNKNADHS